jgi:dethiobiotin synthetase
MRPFFITGIGTDVGKTLVAAILAEAWHADYWKPVQAGYSEGTDSEWVKGVLAQGRDPLDAERRVYPEVYKLAMAASPHIAAREEGKEISLAEIEASYKRIAASYKPAIGIIESSLQPGAVNLQPEKPLIIEGAGGLLVPLNEKEFVLDLAKKLDAPLILVSRNYLGSINHSLLTAAVCKAHGLRVAGWIFNDQYLHYEQEIVQWTGIPVIASIPRTERPDAAWVRGQAERIRPLVQTLVRSTY